MSTSFTPELFLKAVVLPGRSTVATFEESSLYRESFYRDSEVFGNPADWCIIGLLPSYLERQHSSLVMMVDELVKRSGHPASGFYLYDHEALHRNMLQLEASDRRCY
jgi:hypothetical protein